MSVAVGGGNARKLSAVVALNRQWVMCAVTTPKDVFITLRLQRIESVSLSPVIVRSIRSEYQGKCNIVRYCSSCLPLPKPPLPNPPTYY